MRQSWNYSAIYYSCTLSSLSPTIHSILQSEILSQFNAEKRELGEIYRYTLGVRRIAEQGDPIFEMASANPDHTLVGIFELWTHVLSG